MAIDKDKLIKNYFNVHATDRPSFKNAAKYGTIFIAFSVFLVLMQQFHYLQNVVIIATVSFFIGVFAFWLWIKPYFIGNTLFFSRPFDEDMDDWLLEDLHDIVKPKALEQLKINESSIKDENILIVPYPVYWNSPGIDPENIFRRGGDDGLFAYSVWTVQVIVLTDNFISYYSCAYDWINNDIAGEKTNEFFFDDISSVKNDETFIEDKIIDDEEQSVGQAKTIRFTNMSGDSLDIITEIPGLLAPPSTVTSLDKAVQALRIILRNRRYGELVEEKKEKIAEEVKEEIKEEDSSKKRHFHQQLREIHKEYSEKLDEERKKGKDIRDGTETDKPLTEQ